jgi:hypothetical protein
MNLNHTTLAEGRDTSSPSFLADYPICRQIRWQGGQLANSLALAYMWGGLEICKEELLLKVIHFYLFLSTIFADISTG